MIKFPGDTHAWQKWLIAAAVFALFVIPTLQSLSWCVFDWPGFPEKSPILCREWYEDRMDLLKYVISLSMAAIGATWYLATRDSIQISSDDRDYKLLSWAWTTIGIAILSGFLQIFLTYKSFHYWPKVVEEGYSSMYAQARHYAYARALQITYKVTISSFVVGGAVMLFAAIGFLHKKRSTGSAV